MGRTLVGILSLATLVIVGGCNGCRVSTTPGARSADDAVRDNEVIEAAMLDLVGNSDFSPVVHAGTPKKRQIILDDTTLGGVGAWLLETKSLALSDPIRSQLRDDTLRRNPQGQRFSIATFRPADRNVAVLALNDRDLDIEFSDRFPDARGYVQSLLPGFSKDGQTALFGFYFGPTPHGAFGIVILSRESGHWRVKQRFVGYFN
jgi:hypothetical protein